MLECKHVSFAYASEADESEGERPHGKLEDINLSINDGEFVLLCGPSGCGKTTLTRLFNGLIPHYYEGTLSGSVSLDGASLSERSLFEISQKVGSVFQNPRAQFFNVDTTSELAFGPENHGLPETVIEERITTVASQLGLERLLNRSIFSLSGGEKQKIACGSVAAVMPEVFVFDEPSSNLDADAIGDLRRLLQILKAQGKTIVIAEHRLYYLHDLADRVVVMSDGKIQHIYTGADFHALSEAEREKMDLRPIDLSALSALPGAPLRAQKGEWYVRDFHFAYSGQREALAISEATFPAGQVTAVIGHNGAGKSTFTRCLCGLERRCRGTLALDDKIFSRKERLKSCYMVMQDVNHQLFTESVLEEVCLSMPTKNAADLPACQKEAEALLAKMDLLPYKACHPMGLSGGQRQRVAIASALASERPLIVFDEPTSGLDLFHMRQVAEVVGNLANSGKTVVIVTHDPEFILRACNFVLHLEQGKVQESYALHDAEGHARLLKFFMSEGREQNDTILGNT